MQQYDITKDTPAGTYIKAHLGERFTIRMPGVRGRIIEPGLGKQTMVDHQARTEGHGYVEFDMVANETGNEIVEFPLMEEEWDRAADPDSAKAEAYASILIVVVDAPHVAERPERQALAPRRDDQGRRQGHLGVHRAVGSGWIGRE